MKILQITPFFPPAIGGIADHVYNISKNLISFGDSVTIVSPIKILSLNNQMENFSITRIPSLYLLPWPYPTLRNFSIPIDLGKKIDSIIQQGNFDIVHSHGQHYPISWIAIKSAAKHNIPCILTIHTNYGLNPYTLGGKTRLEDYFNKIFFSRILKKTNGVIGLTQSNIEYAKKYSSDHNLYFKIPNGVNLDIFDKNIKNKNQYRKSYNISQDHKVILFCGRFEQVKGIIEFCRAITKISKDFSNVEILIVGEGSLKAEIISIVRNIPSIHILGWQSSDDLYKIYILSDIFVIPSRYEGLPIALLEAMAASLEIVYTPVGSMPEFLKDYPSKIMISNCDIHKIYNALVKALNQNKNTLDNNFSKSNYIFDWKNIAYETKNIYDIVISKMG